MWVVFSDFDDTIFFHNGRGLPEEAAAAIRKFQEEGNLFGINTGRPAWMKQEVMEMIDGAFTPDFYIFSNGSCILNEKGEPIHEVTLPPAVVEDIWKKFPKTRYFVHSMRPGFESGFAVHDGQYYLDLAKGNYEGIYAFSFDYREGEGQEIIEYVQKMDEVDPLKNSAFCDITSPDAGKDKAIPMMLKQLGTPDAHTAAIGDSYNDISMLTAAQQSFTYPSSPEEVKEKADYVVSSLAQALDILNRLH